MLLFVVLECGVQVVDVVCVLVVYGVDLEVSDVNGEMLLGLVMEYFEFKYWFEWGYWLCLVCVLCVSDLLVVVVIGVVVVVE